MAYEFNNADLEQINLAIESSGGDTRPYLLNLPTAISFSEQRVYEDDNLTSLNLSKNTATFQNSTGADATLSLKVNGNYFPRIFFERFNSGTKTNVQYEWSMASNGAILWRNNTNGSVPMSFTYNGSVSVGNNLSSVAKLEVINADLSKDFLRVSSVEGSSGKGDVLKIDNSKKFGFNIGSSSPLKDFDFNGSFRIRSGINSYASNALALAGETHTGVLYFNTTENALSITL